MPSVDSRAVRLLLEAGLAHMQRELSCRGWAGTKVQGGESGYVSRGCL